jgi:hypothetical protein
MEGMATLLVVIFVLLSVNGALAEEVVPKLLSRGRTWRPLMQSPTERSRLSHACERVDVNVSAIGKTRLEFT